MNISPISFTGKPSLAPLFDQAAIKAKEVGFKTPTSSDRASLVKEIEFCREMLKENPHSKTFQKLMEDDFRKLKSYEKI